MEGFWHFLLQIHLFHLSQYYPLDFQFNTDNQYKIYYGQILY